MLDNGLYDRKTTMVIIVPKELVGRTFILETKKD
jgi:hypothetical protein